MKFNKSAASLHQMEAAAARVRYELHREYYDKLADATQRAKENARRAYLEKEIARLKAELADNTEETRRYVKVGSSDKRTANRTYYNNSKKGMRARSNKITRSYKIVPCLRSFGIITEISDMEVSQFTEVSYMKKYID